MMVSERFLVSTMTCRHEHAHEIKLICAYIYENTYYVVIRVSNTLLNQVLYVSYVISDSNS